MSPKEKSAICPSEVSLSSASYVLTTVTSFATIPTPAEI